MGEIFVYVALTTAFAFAFFAFFFIGLLKNNKKLLIWSAVFFVLGTGIGVWSVMVVAKKSVDKVQQVLEPRTPDEVYLAVFGDGEPCAKALNVLDPQVPVMDALLALEATICPKEFNRIIDTTGCTYELIATDTIIGAADWIYSSKVGDSAHVYNCNKPGGGWTSILVSLDTTHMLYLDYE